jgi:hypothetical protein
MTTKASKDYLNDLTRFVGIFVLGGLGIALLALLVYALLDQFTSENRRAIATVAILLLMFGLPAAYAIGFKIAVGHREGFQAGVDQKLDALARARAIPAAPQPPRAASAQPAWQSIVPPAVDIQIQQSRQDDIVIL